MDARTMSLLLDGDLVQDLETGEYGVVTHECIEVQSDWIRIRWSTGVTEDYFFEHPRLGHVEPVRNGNGNGKRRVK